MASTSATKSPKIVIIGAGISGLAAADRLLQHGHSNVVVLEASDRIGGRIRTNKFGNGWVEMGAQWIHGEDSNSAYEYAVKHDLVAGAQSEFHSFEENFLMDDGLAIDPSLAHKVSEAFRKLLQKHRKARSKCDDQMTVEAYVEAAFQDELDSSKCPEEREQKQALLQWCKYFQCSIDGCDNLSELSLRSFQQYRECAGNPLVNFRRGYSSLVDSFAGRIPQNMIHLHRPVLQVELSSAGAANRWQNPVIQVSCQDGSQYSADHVIVSTSLGCLKRNAQTMFHPPLSAEKLECIQKLGFGTIDKIFLEFERAFWPKDSSGYSLAWRPTGPKPVPLHLWYQAIFGFYTVPFASNVLCGWIGGAAARHMETLSDAEVQEMCVRILRQFTRIADMPTVKSMLRSNWQSNPYTRGSYTYFTTGQCFNNCLAKPVTVPFGGKQCPVILFAGEATHPHYYSTVHGALETGWREANRIISYHSHSVKANL